MSILILIFPAAVGVLYSWIVNKFLKNKFLYFLPTIFGILWFIYILTPLYTPDKSGGVNFGIVIWAIMIMVLMVSNIIGSVYFIYKNKNH